VQKSPDSSDIKKSDESRQQHIGRVILLAYRAFASRSVLKLRECGYEQINLAHTSLLANLDAEGTWISTLAERAGISKQSMRQLAIDLERKGYVKRTIDVRDNRATLITFTDAGCQLIQDVQEIKQQMQAECLSLLGQDNMQMLEEGLTRLIGYYSDKNL
jgi:DNA-binding MarR family transcriptional regulator